MYPVPNTAIAHHAGLESVQICREYASVDVKKTRAGCKYVEWVLGRWQIHGDGQNVSYAQKKKSVISIVCIR